MVYEVRVTILFISLLPTCPENSSWSGSKLRNIGEISFEDKNTVDNKPYSKIISFDNNRRYFLLKGNYWKDFIKRGIESSIGEMTCIYRFRYRWSWPHCRVVSYKIKVFLCYVRARARKSFIGKGGKEDRRKRNCSTLKYSYRLPRGRLSDHGSENKWERFFLVSPLLYSLGYYPTREIPWCI